MQIYRIAFFASFLKVNCAKGARETPLGDFDKRNEGVYTRKLKASLVNRLAKQV